MSFYPSLFFLFLTLTLSLTPEVAHEWSWGQIILGRPYTAAHQNTVRRSDSFTGHIADDRHEESFET